jgi:hypothetical protein
VIRRGSSGRHAEDDSEVAADGDRESESRVLVLADALQDLLLEKYDLADVVGGNGIAALVLVTLFSAP